MSHFPGGALPRVCREAGRLRFITLILGTLLVAPSAFAQTLPSGWSTSAVGDPALQGTASYANGVFTLEGGGIDIWDPSDQFRFVYRQVSGDATVIARLDSLERTHPWAKAGVMVRESLSGTSRYAFALASPGKGLAFQRRTTSGGASTSTGASGRAPVWLKIERRGSTFTASRSADGASWTTLGTATISMASTVYIGLAVTSHKASTLATAAFSSVSAGPSSGQLPAGWTATDIGAAAVPGSSSGSGSSFTVASSGSDISGTSDQFRFAYREVSGDVDVVARVASLQAADEWSKAGVMVRSSLASGSAHASVLATGAQGITFQRRPGSGLSTLQTSGGAGAAPIWLKLERRGSAVTAFRSSDGSSWTMIGSETLTLPSTFYVGLAVSSHAPPALATAEFTSVGVASASSSDNTPPTVSLSSPASGATFTAPATVNIAATASDADNGVAMVEFYANGNLLGTDSTSPYSFSWTNVAAGSYSLTAVARDTSGAVATSAARSITVTSESSTNQPPSVSLTAPSSGATYSAPASMTISANASDTDGLIARVDFYAGSTLVGSDTTGPYSVSWSNVPAGSYSLTAVARDNGGATTTSAARSITVNAAAPLTTAVFNPSPDHDTSSVTSYRFEVFTAGANPDTATALAVQDLGKPSVSNGECRADVAATISGLPGGSYFATVRAVGPAGASARAVSAVFSR